MVSKIILTQKSQSVAYTVLYWVRQSPGFNHNQGRGHDGIERAVMGRLHGSVG